MRTLLRILAYLLLIVFLLLSAWQLFEIVCWLVLDGGYKLYLWLGIGAAVYVVLRRIPFFSKNVVWFEIHTHEWLHTVVAWTFGQKIHLVSASENEGLLLHSGRFGRNIFISLAPYCLPIYTLFFCVLRLFSAYEWLHIFDLLIGFTLAFHLVAFIKQAKPYQPDLKVFGLTTSYIFIVASLFFNFLIVLLTIKMGIDNASIFIVEQYWERLQYLYAVIYSLNINLL